MHERMQALLASRSTFGLNSPRTVSGNLKLQPPMASTISNWFHQGV